MRYRRALITQTKTFRRSERAADGTFLCLLEMKPSSLLSPTARIAVLLFIILFFMSQVPPARGRFKEICERPNGSCQDFCLETEMQAGRCLNGRPCCLPLGHQPEVGPTTPCGA
ncbi:beta-defensin 108B [Saccopteryx leptura]|uniref:beta-defensin 108B n=1 Tax=Saccopteryx leptura TaxID=249018 RepID=UPI00339CEBA5